LQIASTLICLEADHNDPGTEMSAIDEPARTAAPVAPDDDVIVIHLLLEAPHAETEVCVCANPDCMTAFNPTSEQAGWTTNRRDHAGGTFKGKFKSCAAKET
jgi:hypothetical protein